MKRNKILLVSSALLLLTGCNSGNQLRGKQAFPRNGEPDHVTYLVLSAVGQYQGATIVDKDDNLFLERFVKFNGAANSDLPGEDVITASSGAKFSGWVSYEGTGALTYYTKVPEQSGKILYAYFGGGSGSQGGGGSGGGGGGQQTSQGGQTSQVTPSGAHGPDGSTAVSWYLCGEGSLWDSTGWTIAGGVQLFSNPDSETDKGCILSLPVAVGDNFKVTNGTEWFGYDKVDQYESAGNAGRTNFEALNDGYGGSNIKCTVAGTYDIYVNKDGKFWIQLSA